MEVLSPNQQQHRHLRVHFHNAQPQRRRRHTMLEVRLLNRLRRLINIQRGWHPEHAALRMEEVEALARLALVEVEAVLEVPVVPVVCMGRSMHPMAP